MTASLIAVAAAGYALFQVAGVQAGVARIEQGQLDAKLQEHYRAVCVAGNGTVDARLWELIRELEKRYKEITGTDYHSTPCDLLLKLK